MARRPNIGSLEGRLNAVRQDLDRVSREVDKLKAQEALILDMLQEARGPKDLPERQGKPQAPHRSAKQTVLALLQRVGNGGLNTTKALQLAAKDGVSLERATVSSLLSRLKGEGVIFYDGSVYKLGKFKTDLFL